MQYSQHLHNATIRHENAKRLPRPIAPVTLADISPLDWRGVNHQAVVNHTRLPRMRDAKTFYGGDYTPSQSTYGLFAQRIY